MLLPRLLLGLALSGPPDQAIEPAKELAPADRMQVERMQALVVGVGGPLLAARTAQEFEQVLVQIVNDPEYSGILAEIVRLAVELDLTQLPAELDDAIDRYVEYFGEDQRWRVRQTFDMLLEIADRSATLIVPLLNEDDPRLQVDLDTLFKIDYGDLSERLEPARVSMACNLAAAAAIADDDIVVASAEVRAVLMDRWFTSTQSMLANIDPIQADLDAILNAQRSRFPQVTRVTYSRKLGASGEPTCAVWLVLDDDAPEELDLKLVTDSRLQFQVEEVFANHDPSVELVSLHVRLASEPGPVEDLLEP